LVKTLGGDKNRRTVLVIDEVDQFNKNERAFTCLIKSILSSSKSQLCNCSIIGIANAVDLPFRKKHSAIAMRDC
jgi:Cdc6-like AAA superfamily ATPase